MSQQIPGLGGSTFGRDPTAFILNLTKAYKPQVAALNKAIADAGGMRYWQTNAGGQTLTVDLAPPASAPFEVQALAFISNLVRSPGIVTGLFGASGAAPPSTQNSGGMFGFMSGLVPRFAGGYEANTGGTDAFSQGRPTIDVRYAFGLDDAAAVAGIVMLLSPFLLGALSILVGAAKSMLPMLLSAADGKANGPKVTNDAKPGDGGKPAKPGDGGKPAKPADVPLLPIGLVLAALFL